MNTHERALSPEAPKHWSPKPLLIRAACAMATGLIVDLCPGTQPLPIDGAKQIGWGYDETDITRDRLPFGDKEVDFLYCRHTLEDLLDPGWTISEISRVAKSGWIETPSMASELARGVEGMWRGFHHHRSMFFDNDGVLVCIPKYAILEYTQFNGIDFPSVLASPMAWDFVYTWVGELQFSHLRHERDFWITGDYAEIVARYLSRTL